MKIHISKVNLIKVGIVALLFVVVLWIPLTALAHETVKVGDYSVEYGWVNEPAVVGQPNAFVVNLTNDTAAAGSADATNIDISGLQVQVVYGDQSKTLTLQPLGENTPGQFIAPITPMIPGKYTLHLGGKIGTTDFNNDVQPEEVQTADVVQFPVQAPAQASSSAGALGLVGWLAIAGILLGAAGTILGLFSLARK